MCEIVRIGEDISFEGTKDAFEKELLLKVASHSKLASD